MIQKEIREMLQSIAIHTRKRYSTDLRKIGLHIGQELALHYLWEKDGITQSQLRKKIGSEASTMSNMLRKLENDQIIFRKTSKDDHRATKVYLTEKGKQLQEPIEKIWKNHEAVLLDGLITEELLLLRRLLQQMETNLIE